MDQNDLDSFTLGLIQRTKERNKFLEQMNLTVESPISSTINSTIDSNNAPTLGSPVSSKNTPTFGSPIRSKDAPTFRSPTGFRSVQAIGSPVGSKNVQTIGSPVRSKNILTFGSPIGFKSAQTLGSPTNSQNAPTFGSAIDSKNIQIIGSPVRSKTVQTFGSPVDSKTVQTFGSPVKPQNAPTFGSTIDSKNVQAIGSPIRSKNAPTFGSPVKSQNVKVSLDFNPKKGQTIGSLHSSAFYPNNLKDNSKNEPIKNSKNDGKIDLRNDTESKVDSTDPCLLPLAARRALFEKKMCQPVAKAHKIEEAIDTFKETLKGDLSGSNVIEVNTPTYGDENINPKESYSSESNVSSRVYSSSDDDNYNPKRQDFKSNLNYSTDSDEKDPSDNDKNFDLNEQNCPKQSDINESIGFNVSVLLSCADENVSVIRQSTKIYPELPQSDELTDVHETSSEKDEHPLQNFISPIRGCDDQTMLVSPKKSAKIDSVKPKSIQPTTPLRTLSMYRREQNIRKTISSSVEEDELITDLETEAQKREWLKKYHEYKSKKMEELKIEADKYNKIIYQSFRALNLCIQTNNVTERIEAEKILLVNMLKKNACVDELYRLQKEEIDVPMDPVGKITFNKLTLLVKGNFFVSQASGIDLCDYHFICLFICGDKVVATDALSSNDAIQEASLNFTNKIVFGNLRKDFRIRLVIYALALPKGKRSHDKRHLRLTPKTKSKIKYTHSPALKASPRNEKIKCNFKRMGYVDFTRDNIMTRDNVSKSRFSLENFMFDSPLEDQIIVDLTTGCHYNFKFGSYLNFHETSGEYPVWNRRWCVLNGPSIHFWRYSEDEGDKPPMGVINLKRCLNPSIIKASTDICMRPNSFSFTTFEKQNDSFIPVKHLMAADVRKERDGWLENLNKAIEIIRLWESDCVKPMDQDSLDRLFK